MENGGIGIMYGFSELESEKKVTVVSFPKFRNTHHVVKLQLTDFIKDTS